MKRFFAVTFVCLFFLSEGAFSQGLSLSGSGLITNHLGWAINYNIPAGNTATNVGASFTDATTGVKASRGWLRWVKFVISGFQTNTPTVWISDMPSYTNTYSFSFTNIFWSNYVDTFDMVYTNSFTGVIYTNSLLVSSNVLTTNITQVPYRKLFQFVVATNGPLTLTFVTNVFTNLNIPFVYGLFSGSTNNNLNTTNWFSAGWVDWENENKKSELIISEPYSL